MEQYSEDLWNLQNMRPRRPITVRNFVIAVATAAASYLVYRRTGDELLTLASLPIIQGFLCYWLAQ
ncbi:hypothetical protein ACFO0M_11115 [Micromonospora mangrovi]|uniref:Uncharacterized protein n=2 Tax=Micromonospora TaxID=1873 RepID=A0AAU8HC49_9ACTN